MGDDLHYRCSFKLNFPSEKFLEEEIRGAEYHLNSFKKPIPDAVEIEGMSLLENNLLAYQLLQKRIIRKIIIKQGPYGELDLEVRGSKVYLHVFDSIKQPVAKAPRFDLNSHNEKFNEITNLKKLFKWLIEAVSVQPPDEVFIDLDSDIQMYKERFGLERVIEENVSPLREEHLKQYAEKLALR